MFPTYALALLFVGHFVADFICQTDKMAINKSKDINWLSIHVSVYSMVLAAFAFPVFSSSQGWESFVIVNLMLHFCVDAVTSRATSFLWKKNERHWFFVVIGFDQLLHALSILFTYEMFK